MRHLNAINHRRATHFMFACALTIRVKKIFIEISKVMRATNKTFEFGYKIGPQPLHTYGTAHNLLKCTSLYVMSFIFGLDDSNLQIMIR